MRRKIELSVIISGNKLQSSSTVVFIVFFLLGPLRPKKWTTIVRVVLNFTTDIKAWLLQKPKSNRVIHTKRNFIFAR